MPEIANLWDNLSRLPRLDINLPQKGGLWDAVDQALDDAQQQKAPIEAAVLAQPSPDGISLSYQMRGAWEDIEEETLLLRPEELTLWYVVDQAIAAEETRRAASGDAGAQNGLWEAVNDETLLLGGRSRPDDVWASVNEETLLMKPARRNVWEMISQDQLVNYRPQRIKNWVLKPLRDQNGEPYFMLKNVDQARYLRLAPQQRFLWDQFDGNNSLQDIVIAYLVAFQSFDVDGLLKFLDMLEADGFLANPRIDVYEVVAQERAQHSLWTRFISLAPKLISFELPVSGLDHWIDRLYRAAGFLFFKKAIYAALVLITLSGTAAFLVHNSAVLGSMGKSMEGSPLWVLVTAYAMLAIVILIHELSHALTVKHYRREVRRGGVGLYMGMLVFFVDTSDIWLSPRKARLAVSWNGPFSGFVLASLFSLIAPLVSDPVWSGLLYESALTAYLVSALQLNPLLKQDGYYILMDWMEIPRLHERSIEFVRGGLWQRIKARERLAREEMFFTLFGVLSLLWTVFSLYMFIVAGGRWILGFFH